MASKRIYFRVSEAQEEALDEFCIELSKQRDGEAVTRENALLYIFNSFMKERKNSASTPDTKTPV